MAVRVAVVHGNDGSDVRIGKSCRSLARLGFDTHFVGWDRRPDARKEIDLGGASAHLVRRSTLHGRGSLQAYAGFIAHTVRTLARLRPDVVCAVNEELAFALLPFKGTLYRRLVCDIFDSLGPRAARRPAPLRAALRVVAAAGQAGADRLIATDEHRRQMLGTRAAKAIVVENVPEDPGEALAARLPAGVPRIWVGGSLDETRGLRQLLAAVDALPAVEIVSAGWPYDDFAADVFLKHPRVRYEGIVTARRALELAASCDAVFSYYAPINEYMINASPNKVYDALAVGRPVLINAEVRLAAWVEREGIGYAAPYADAAAIARCLAELAGRRAGLGDFAARARDVFRERYHWGLMEPRLESLYGELGHAVRR